MIYLVCFCIALVMLLFIVAYEKAIDVNLILLIAVVAVGNGGYYALYSSQNLEEAILANTMSYVIGIFAPTVLFLIICNICHVFVPKIVSSILYAVQIVIFLTVSTVGKSDIFYKTVEYSTDGGGAYLIKTYGPMHSVFLVFLLLYTTAGIVVCMYSLSRKTVVSRTNVNIILFMDMLVVGVYLVEKFIHLEFELIPIFLTFSIAVIMVPLIRISVYSVYNNKDIFEDEINSTGYIIFSRKLKYMGCNDYAKVLFPELDKWELEKKIPGNGGRFNTFLRKPLMDYVKENTTKKTPVKTYGYKGQIYRYEIAKLMSSKKWSIGYLIKVHNVTEVIRENAKVPSEQTDEEKSQI
ncbi:histidine kinase N-terminal 7TM domain-containing protein [Butyrivibrio sp.]|uniref:histidine kinase N-terminal 7TM domain-containing protein n=1 Tax=Butyrivibrio sp. TaxID=28121 RepID=UPI0025BCC96E|nr:histidine kinase N-terminal 7TM domain-containing protein [Butyrivibrio sp.]MBE5837282.1 hypothetical protein [Butyrivibrio sp.]